MRTAPRASVTDEIIGRNSGVSPTASATAKTKDSNAGLCVATRTIRMNRTRKKTVRVIRIPNCFMLRSKSVSSGRIARRSAMAPKMVCEPVLKISALAVPLTTDVPRKTRFGASGPLEDCPSGTSDSFSTGNDSPVSADCWT